MTPAAAAFPGIRPPSDVNPRTEPVLDFPDREYGSLAPADYEALGFLGGLEVHQQLLTRRKLFCRCPAGRYVDRADGEVLRHMRPTLSELGEYDGTALMEFKTRKEIVYLLDRGSVCTYELDDTPPFPMDDEAIDIAIGVAQLLNLNLVAELHVMRKQYLDGSIPTGFQRTAMVGLTGQIPFRVPELGVDRALSIRQLSLEEDSCREVSDVGHRVTFRTDRLGMPLTEVVTEPEFLTPEEMQAGGRLLAQVVRATGRVRRGPGAARQDVNVSVAGGRRVEIKGVDNHRFLPRLVHNEGYRQLNLLRVRAELRRRGVTGTSMALPAKGLPWECSALVADVSRLFDRSRHSALRAAREVGMTVCAVRLPGFAGLLAHRTQPGLTFAHEIAERIRVIACPAHHRFLAHSDAADDTAIAARRWRDVRAAVGAGADDAVVVVWADAPDAATAAREVLIRAQDALAGVPAETRQANHDGTTGFERILPGADRMYPDTDTPPIPIPDATIERIRVSLPETPWARAERYCGLGLAPARAQRLAAAPWADVFDGAAPPAGNLARRLAASLAKRLPYHVRAGRRVPDAAGAVLREALARIAAGESRAEALDRIVDAAVMRPGAPPAEVLAPFAPPPPADANQLVERAGDAARRMTGRGPDTLLRWAMGEVMPRLLGRADPRDVRRRLEERLLGVGAGAGQ
ncbi:MAG TPA: Glu-tRNA(Gln) amidotransferase subunit GatE [Gemmatimonadales bacterium]